MSRSPSGPAAGAALLLLASLIGACEDAPEARREASRRIAPDAVSADANGETVQRTTEPATATAGCGILTEEQVEQAVGFDVVTSGNAMGNCIVTPADGSPGETVVDFRVEPRTAAYDYIASQPDAESVPGLGDRAVWATLNESTGTLVVVLGNRAIVVTTMRADGLDARSRRQAEAIATAMVAREQRG